MAIFSSGTLDIEVVAGGVMVDGGAGRAVGGVLTRDMKPSSLKKLLNPPRTRELGGKTEVAASYPSIAPHPALLRKQFSQISAIVSPPALPRETLAAKPCKLPS